MAIMMNVVMVLQVLAALGVIGLVLVQHGKGADMGAAFGSGSSGSLFGATGSANFLSRATGVLAGIFFITTLALSFASHKAATPTSGGSVMDRPATSVPAAVAPADADKSGGTASGKTGEPAAPGAPGNAPAAGAGNQTGQIPK